MNFQEALDFLYTRHATGMKLGLENIQSLMHDLNHPHREFKSIHIAGTNGKGSTASVLASILEKAGYKTGLYTSPHLVNVRERIQVNGVMIPESRFVQYLQENIPLIEKNNASYFEIMTAMAFLYFRDEKVGVAILETGLGGRLDATNVILPELCVITDISFDHTKTLGHRLNAIASEKAGIYKKHVPCVIGVQRPSVVKHLKRLADQKSVPFYSTKLSVQMKTSQLDESGCQFQFKWENICLKDLHFNLLGSHQVKNAATALLAIHVLKEKGWNIPEEFIRTGLKHVNWPARLQLFSGPPKLLVDSAHNNAGIKNLILALRKILKYRKLIFIFGVLKDKDYTTMLKMITSISDCILFTKPNNERALDPIELQQNQSIQNEKTEVHEHIHDAIERAYNLADKEDLICAAGSIYFVGEVLDYYQHNKDPDFRIFSD